ncbi:MAG: radical SAM family heme chaperone HemW [Acidobacteriota bacterium]|nr:radical SAM family heme chaperone HemW [Acidobacteriota bacterium]
MSEPLAVYIHVPFCGQRCAYCHFDIKVFHPRTDRAPFIRRYLQAVTRELQTYAGRYGRRPVSSVFFGGGTPSRLGATHLGGLMTAVRRAFNLTGDCEISVEVNPEDGDPVFLQALRDMGVNRVSFGVQTFHDASLEAIKRPHDGARAMAVLKSAPRFSKGVSLDLILGLPFQTTATLRRDLDLIQAIAPQHVALYMLETDLPTPLDKLTEAPRPDEDTQADFYDMVCERLGAAGFEHYEISNFCKPGFACRHNLVYWQRGDYLGIGPAAHGQVGATATANHPRLADYCRLVEEQGRGVISEEHWTAERLRQERIIQGLRLSAGVETDLLTVEEVALLSHEPYRNLLVIGGGRLRLSARGRLLANEIFSLFIGNV